MPKKTRPIGLGVRNITVTLPIPEVLRTERQARISGVARSPYIRTLVEWANDHGVIVRPEAASYSAYLAAIQGNVSPLPAIKYELIITNLVAPLQVVMDPRDGRKPGASVIYLDAYDTPASRVAEVDPTSAAASRSPAMPRKRKHS